MELMLTASSETGVSQNYRHQSGDCRQDWGPFAPF